MGQTDIHVERRDGVLFYPGTVRDSYRVTKGLDADFVNREVTAIRSILDVDNFFCRVGVHKLGVRFVICCMAKQARMRTTHKTRASSQTGKNSPESLNRRENAAAIQADLSEQLLLVAVINESVGQSETEKARAI